MKQSRTRILTTHIGSLPRPDALLAANQRRLDGQASDQELAAQLAQAVAGVVRQQVDCGIDIVNDGEFGKLTTTAQDYGPWMSYAWERLAGWESMPQQGAPPMLRDHDQFPGFYPAMWREMGGGSRGAMKLALTCAFTAPVRYRGQALIGRDLANLKAALAGARVEEGFVTAIAPGSFNRGQNRHYRSERDFMLALADAMHEEYQAIVDAGLVLQIDDPSLADAWAMAPTSMSKQEYRDALLLNVEAVNRALEGIPRDRVRYHVCWGSWHGPHMTDIPIEDILDRILSVNAGAYALEAANVRHELDFRAWQRIRIPEQLLIITGVVSHATNLVEPPELVAERIRRYAEIFGRERVIAGTDCGLGGRVHAEIAWAKLRALAQGAKLASEQLWRA